MTNEREKVFILLDGMQTKTYLLDGKLLKVQLSEKLMITIAYIRLCMHLDKLIRNINMINYKTQVC